MSYRGARCTVCSTVHNNAQLIHAKITHFINHCDLQSESGERGTIVYNDQTDNYRVRPDPGNFEALLQDMDLV